MQPAGRQQLYKPLLLVNVMVMPDLDFNHLRSLIADQFALDLDSIHGPSHWERVEAWGLRLAAATPDADPVVVRLFAIFHDSRRVNEFTDPQHGERGGELARRMHDVWFQVDAAQLEQLIAACAGHELGNTSDDPTIGCCWDADRLDLPRVGISPRPEFMSTETARQWTSRRPGMS